MNYDYGKQWLRYFWWHYPLTKAAALLSATGRELRWYGVTIPGTQIGLGVFVRRSLTGGSRVPDGEALEP